MLIEINQMSEQGTHGIIPERELNREEPVWVPKINLALPENCQDVISAILAAEDFWRVALRDGQDSVGVS